MFPVVERDLAFIIDKECSAKSIMDTAKQSAGPLLTSINVFDVFEGASIGQGKRSLGLRFYLQSGDRTLTGSEVDTVMKLIVDEVVRIHNAVLRTS